MKSVQKILKNKLVLAVLIVAVMSVIFAIYFIHRSDNSTELPGLNSKENNSASGDKASISNSQGDKNEATSTSDELPLTPYGVFVSNHMMSLKSQAANSMSSTCQTSPGSTCKIVFIRGEVKKELPEQDVDDQGNTEWYWTLSDIELSEGSWTVRAVSLRDGNESSTTDPKKLEITP